MADLRIRFNEKLNKRIATKKPCSFLILDSEYKELINDLKRINVSGCKEKSDYVKRKRFGLKSVGETTKVVKSGTDLVFLSTSELFDQIHTAHIQLGHGCRDVLLAELQKRFANVTRDVVMDYLGLCEECQKKKSKTSKHIVVKPIISNDMNSRCQMDLIDMQSQPDGDYRFILVYQDHLTKFVQLRPLKTKTADEVANVLVDIFSIFGAPHILHTDNGREFKNKLISEILLLWPGCKQVHGKPRHSQTQGSVERANRDVEDKLKCWMADYRFVGWPIIEKSIIKKPIIKKSIIKKPIIKKTIFKRTMVKNTMVENAMVEITAVKKVASFATNRVMTSSSAYFVNYPATSLAESPISPAELFVGFANVANRRKTNDEEPNAR